jgi:hypothetical protein
VIDKFVRAFVSNNDGTWFCREAARFVGPHGPMSTTPGVTYRRGKLNQGYDVALWLDEWRDQQIGPTGIDFL